VIHAKIKAIEDSLPNTCRSTLLLLKTVPRKDGIVVSYPKSVLSAKLFLKKAAKKKYE